MFSVPVPSDEIADTESQTILRPLSCQPRGKTPWAIFKCARQALPLRSRWWSSVWSVRAAGVSANPEKAPTAPAGSSPPSSGRPGAGPHHAAREHSLSACPRRPSARGPSPGPHPHLAHGPCKAFKAPELVTGGPDVNHCLCPLQRYGAGAAPAGEEGVRAEPGLSSGFGERGRGAGHSGRPPARWAGAAPAGSPPLALPAPANPRATPCPPEPREGLLEASGPGVSEQTPPGTAEGRAITPARQDARRPAGERTHPSHLRGPAELGAGGGDGGAPRGAALAPGVISSQRESGTDAQDLGCGGAAPLWDRSTPARPLGQGEGSAGPGPHSRILAICLYFSKQGSESRRAESARMLTPQSDARVAY